MFDVAVRVSKIRIILIILSFESSKIIIINFNIEDSDYMTVVGKIGDKVNKGPSKNYVTPILAIFRPLPPM